MGKEGLKRTILHSITQLATGRGADPDCLQHWVQLTKLRTRIVTICYALLPNFDSHLLQ